MKKEEKTKVKKEENTTNKKKDKNVVEKKNVKTTKKEKKENIFNRIIKYFKGVGKEFKRVRWTSGKDLIKYSVSTIIFVLFFGLYFYGIDWIALLVRSLAN